MTHSMMRGTIGLSAIALVAVSLLATPSRAQQTNQSSSQSSGFGFRGIGARLGLTDPEGGSSALMYGVHVDAGEFVPHLHVIPSLEYWSVGNDVGIYNADLSDLAFKLDADLDFPLQNSRLTPYIGGGLGIHRVKFETNQFVFTPGDLDSKDTKLGFTLQGGMKNDFTPNLAFFGELGYTFLTDTNQLRLLGGFTYHFIY